MQEIGKNSHNNNKIHGLKQFIQSNIKSQQNRSIIRLTTPRLRKLITHS